MTGEKKHWGTSPGQITRTYVLDHHCLLSSASSSLYDHCFANVLYTSAGKVGIRIIICANANTLNALARSSSTLAVIAAWRADQGTVLLPGGGVLQSTLWSCCDTCWNITWAEDAKSACGRTDSAANTLNLNVNLVRLASIFGILIVGTA